MPEAGYVVCNTGAVVFPYSDDHHAKGLGSLSIHRAFDIRFDETVQRFFVHTVTGDKVTSSLLSANGYDTYAGAREAEDEYLLETLA